MFIRASAPALPRGLEQMRALGVTMIEYRESCSGRVGAYLALPDSDDSPS